MDQQAFRYRLAAVDIDDTLAGHDKQISPENRSAVERLQAAGCRVVLASGRRHDNMVRYARSLRLSDFVISAQGAMVQHADTGQTILNTPLDLSLADEVIELGLSLGLGMVVFTPEGAFSPAVTDWTEKLKRDTGGDLVYVERVPPAQASAVEKVLWCDDPKRLSMLFDEMSSRYLGQAIVTITDPHLLEYCSPLATKAAGLSAVAQHYGVPQDQVIAFGDGNNDVPMLGWAGLGVAMSHASPNAKAAADLVAPPGNPETSLARAVEMILGG